MSHTSRGTKRSKRLLTSGLAGVGLALLLPATTRAATPELILDLRVAGSGDPKTALVESVGDVVNLELYALVLDANGGTDGFNATQGAWLSLNSGLKGNFSTSLVTGFNQFGSQNPAPTDLDGDGDLDVGAVASASTGHWIASSGATSYTTLQGSEIVAGSSYQRWLIGTATFTVADLASGNTQLSYVPRTGSTLVKPHKYTTDGTFTSLLGSDSRLALGAAVLVTGPSVAIWNGGSGNWSNASKWNLGVVPNNAGTARYNVFIDNGNATASVATLDTDVTINQLTISASDQLAIASGHSLIVNNAVSHSGIMSLASSASATFNGAVAGSGNFSNNGSLVFASGPTSTISDISGSGAVTVAAGRTLTAAHVQLANLTVNGTFAANSGLDAAGLVTVAAAGSAQVSGAVTGGAAVANNGLLSFIGSGSVTIGNVTGSGTTSVASGKTLSAVGVSQAALSMTGSAAVSVSGNVSLSSASGSSIPATGSFTSTGSLTLSGGAGANFIVSGVSNSVGGAIHLSGGDLTANSALSAGSVDGANNVNWLFGNSIVGDVSNAGTHSVAPGVSLTAGNLSGHTAFNVNGTAGVASISGTGSTTVAAGASLTGSGSLTQSSLSDNGSVNLGANSVTVTGAVTVGTGSGPATLTAGAISANTLTLTGGASSTATISSLTGTGASPTATIGSSTTLTSSGNVASLSGLTVNGLAKIGGSVSAGTITVNSGGTLKGLASPTGDVSTTTFNVNGVAEVGNVTSTSTTVGTTGNLTAGNMTGHTSFTVNGTASVGGVQGSGNTTVATGASLTADHVRQGTLTVNGTGTIRTNSSDTGVSKVSSLAIAGSTNAWTGTLQLNDNDLVVAGGATPSATLATVTNQIKSGLNLPGGYWNGTGITSGAAAADLGQHRALGVMLNDTGGGSPVYTSFSGQSVSLGDTLVKYTYYGDLNLDGTVDLGNDFSMFVDGYNNARTGWRNGDLNYDGVVDVENDFSIFVDGYNSQGVALTVAQITQMESLLTPVPEPLSLTWIVLGSIAAAHCGRRRPRRDFRESNS